MIMFIALKRTRGLRMLAGVGLGIVLALAFAGRAGASSGGEVFGFESFTSSLVNQDGSPAVQAGSHPYELTASLVLYHHLVGFANRPFGDPKNVEVNLPAGLVIDPSATETRCTEAQINTTEHGACPVSSQVGTVTGDFGVFDGAADPLFNMVPQPGEPAEFAFIPVGVGVVVHILPKVRTGGDYGLSGVTAAVLQEAPVWGVSVALWGNPSDPSHDSERNCYGNPADCLARPPIAVERVNRPLLTAASACGAQEPTTVRMDSWQEPENWITAESPSLPLIGCDLLDFSPSLSVQPETAMAGSPTGLSVGLHVPQNDSLEGLAEADLREGVIHFPAGMTLSPSAANGLGACTPEEIALNNAQAPSCPDSSKLGSVEITTPLLGSPLGGSLYLAQQGNAGAGQGSNPYGSLVAFYLVAEGSGVLIKLPGEGQLDPVTGQVTARFGKDPLTGFYLPQQPFSDLKVSMFGGPRAPFVTPSACGSYTTTSQLTPYSTPTPAEPSSAFQITGGCGAEGFNPGFTAGTSVNQAGAFSPLSVTFSRQDSEQDLGGIAVTTPPGLLAILKSVVQCPEPQASQGACGPQSLIGHTTVTAGPGPDPVVVQGGQVFLTGPYKGAPFGLSIVVPAAAGPFNLGTQVVRAAISIDPHTAQATIVSDPLPSILQGIPLQIRTVNVSIDREGFMFNPTNCEPLSVNGTLTSTQGATAGVSSHFEAANCANLPFHPVFSVSTQARSSKQNGASLDVKTTFPAGAQANIRSVAVSLPKQLPARLTTIQQACTGAVFAVNPASCPAGSDIGIGTATTPVLANPVSGPAYLVSHGGAAFPDVVVVLQGEGVTVELTGGVNIKHGVTSSDFAAVPDAPISSFELNLPEGPHSGLSSNLPAKAKGNFCGQSLVMPLTITGQNGAVIKQNAKIAVTGCAKVKRAKAHRKHKRAKGKRK